MKKFVFGLLSMLFGALGAEPAQALTLQWDEPGAIEVRTSRDDASSKLDIDPAATSFELTEKQQYFVCPAPGYQLVSTEVISGGKTTFNINNYGKGQFISVNNEWVNGYTVKVNTRKLAAAGTITVNVLNGAEKISGQLANQANYNMSTSTPVAFKEGKQTVSLTDADDMLQLMKADGVALQAINSVKLNGEAQTPDAFQKTLYKVPVKDGDKVEIQVYDPNNIPTEYTATFKFKNGDDKALKGVYNVTALAGKSHDEMVAAGWTLTCEENNRLRLQLNDDYDFTGITANGEAMDFDVEMGQAMHTITANTEFVIDAKAKEYDPITAQVYVTEPEGVTFYSVYSEEGDEDNKLTLTEGEAANGVTMGEITVPDGTKSFTLADINPKTGKIFFTVKPGYYVKVVACANPETAGENDITTMGSWNAQNGPFFMDIRKVDNSASAVIAYVGEEGAARIRAYNAQGEIISVAGLQDELTPGYTEFDFDPVYNDHFQVRNAGSDKAMFVYLNGEACTADDNGVFQNIKLTDGSLLKVFLATAAPENHRVNFILNDGLTATVKYDKIYTHTDLSQPLVSRGATLVELTPSKDCIVKVNGETLSPVDWRGTYAFTTEKLITKVELSKKPLALMSTKPAEGKAVKNFSTATISFAMDENGESGVTADAEKIEAITLTTPAGETVKATACEAGEPSYYTGIPFDISFPEQTAVGQYTLTIPAGTFCETAWSDADESFVAKENGSVNDEIVLHFTVDPEASVFKKCVMTPADGSAIRSISTINVKFPDVTGWMQAYDDEAEVTLSNGTTTYNGYASPDWSTYPVINSFNVTFQDNESEEMTITEAGEWTLTVGAGLFAFEDETTPAITAKFTVDPKAPISWTADPENGSKQDLPVTTEYSKYTMITLTFDAESVSYTSKNDANVDDEGDGDKTGETGTIGGIRVTYRGQDVDRVEDVQAEGANGYMLYDNFGEPQVIFAFNNSVFEKPGELVIECDEGTFTIDDEASPAISYSVTFGDIKEYTAVFTPAAGSEVESIKEFTIEFPEAATATYDEDNSYIILRGMGWICPTNPIVTAVEGAEHPTFKLEFDCIDESMNLRAGEYSMRIGEGTFSLDGDQQSPETYASWTLKRTTPVDKSWSAEPVRDMVNEGYGMYPAFKFSETEVVGRNYRTDAKITVKFNGEEIEQGSATDDKMAYITREEISAFMFEISGGILNNKETEGKLTITVEEGALLISGEPCERMEHSWNLVKEKEYEVKVTPADGSAVKELKNFTIEFIGAKTADKNLDYGITVRSKDYKHRGEVESITFDNSGENAKVNISLKEALTADGEYLLQIHPTTFFLDGCQSSPEINVSYTVDQTVGVEGIEAGNGNYTVVNLSGIVVLRGASAAALSKLPAGLYIVNGKKVMLNK